MKPDPKGTADNGVATITAAGLPAPTDGELSTNTQAPQTLQAALGLGPCVGGTDDVSPMLPLDCNEPGLPTPIPTPSASDDDILDRLQRLAGADGEAARTALRAALSGESYRSGDLPNARAMLLGMARTVLAYGVAPDDLINAIMDALHE